MRNKIISKPETLIDLDIYETLKLMIDKIDTVHPFNLPIGTNVYFNQDRLPAIMLALRDIGYLAQAAYAKVHVIADKLEHEGLGKHDVEILKFVYDDDGSIHTEVEQVIKYYKREDKK